MFCAANKRKALIISSSPVNVHGGRGGSVNGKCLGLCIIIQGVLLNHGWR